MHNDIPPAFAKRTSSLQPHNTSTTSRDQLTPSPNPSDRFSTPELVSAPSSPRPNDRSPPNRPFAASGLASGGGQSVLAGQKSRPSPEYAEKDDEEVWDDFGGSEGSNGDDRHTYFDDDMPSDLRPSLDRHNGGKSHDPLLSSKDGERHMGYDSPPRPTLSRRSTAKLHERDPEVDARRATRKRYTYAAFFLVLSLISFAVQTETAVYIQSKLHWEKAYCMLYFTHGSWSILWPFSLLILRLQKWSTPWDVFWRRHKQILTQTAQMVRYQNVHPTARQSSENPWPFMARTTAFVTVALTFAGISWYIAINLTTASDLTAIYNCSAFFAYTFSVPLLHEKVRMSKVLAVAVAIVGVLVVAYGGSTHTPKHGGKSGGGAGGPDHDSGDANGDHPYRFIGNVVIGVGSVLYGFYEVLYKKVACPPEETSPGRGMIFANAFGSMIGCFTLTVLWIPLPILHYTGIETFELPRGEAAWMMLISVVSNAIFSGSFLVLISLTSPVLSSVAALLTIFIVAIIDQLLPPPFYSPLTGNSMIGGLLIIVAFVVLSWATYKEMDEERRRKAEEADVAESDIGDLDDD